MDLNKKIALLFHVPAGLQMGLIAAYFGIYKYNVGGVRIVLLTAIIASMVSFIGTPIMKKVEDRIDNLKLSLIIANLGLILADIPLLFGYLYHSNTLLIINAFMHPWFGILFWKNLDYYPMSLSGMQNRAIIVSKRNFNMNIATGVGAFLSYFLYKSVLLLVLTVFFIRVIASLLLWFCLPDAPQKHEVVEDARPIHHHFTLSPKIVFVFIAFFVVLFANQIYGNARPLFISQVFGNASVSFTVGVSAIISAFAISGIMRFTTKYGRIVARTGWVLIAFALSAIIAGDASYFILAVLGRPVISASILSYRHYIIKKLPQDQTANVLYANNILSSLSALPLLLLMNTDPVELALISIAVLMLGVMLFAVSKITSNGSTSQAQ